MVVEIREKNKIEQVTLKHQWSINRWESLISVYRKQWRT